MRVTELCSDEQLEVLVVGKFTLTDTDHLTVVLLENLFLKY
jgi:hypothetical protein